MFIGLPSYAQVTLVDSDDGAFTGAVTDPSKSIAVQSGDMVVLALSSNKRVSGTGEVLYSLANNVGSTATIGSVTSLNSAFNSNASSTWLFYTTVTSDGNLTLDITSDASQSASRSLRVLRATDSGNSLGIVTDSFSATYLSGADTSDSLSFTPLANAVSGSSNYSMVALSSSETGSIVNATGFTIANSNGTTRFTGFNNAVSTAASPFTVTGTISGTDSNYDFNGIGAVVYAIPEPSSLLLMTAALLGIIWFRRRK